MHTSSGEELDYVIGLLFYVWIKSIDVLSAYVLEVCLVEKIYFRIFHIEMAWIQYELNLRVISYRKRLGIVSHTYYTCVADRHYAIVDVSSNSLFVQMFYRTHYDHRWMGARRCAVAYDFYNSIEILAFVHIQHIWTFKNKCS